MLLGERVVVFGAHESGGWVRSREILKFKARRSFLFKLHFRIYVTFTLVRPTLAAVNNKRDKGQFSLEHLRVNQSTIDLFHLHKLAVSIEVERIDYRLLEDQETNGIGLRITKWTDVMNDVQCGCLTYKYSLIAVILVPIICTLSMSLLVSLASTVPTTVNNRFRFSHDVLRRRSSASYSGIAKLLKR